MGWDHLGTLYFTLPLHHHHHIYANASSLPAAAVLPSFDHDVMIMRSKAEAIIIDRSSL